MTFPKPPEPPSWYWRMSLKNRQRYCKWFNDRWWAVYFFWNKWMNRQGFRMMRERVSFWWFCIRLDFCEWMQDLKKRLDKRKNKK